jgi:hypothetical protein
MDFLTNSPELFPLVRGGGGFLIAVGLGILVGSLGRSRRFRIVALIAGAALGVAVMAVGGATKIIFDGIGYPEWWQWAVLGLAVLIEGYLVNVVVEKNPDRDSRSFWMWMLFVVGAHFLVLTASHGPICGTLGLICMANALVGLRSSRVPFRVFWAIDGVLKMAAGSGMVAVSYA